MPWTVRTYHCWRGIRLCLWSIVLCSTAASVQYARSPISTSTISESSVPPVIIVVTSVVTASGTTPGESNTPVTVVVTRTNDATSSHITSMTMSSSSSLKGVPSPESYTMTSEALVGSASTTAAPSSNTTSMSRHGLSTEAVATLSVCITLRIVVLGFASRWFWMRHRKLRASHRATEETRATSACADVLLPTEKDGTPVSELQCPPKLKESHGNVIGDLEMPVAELEGDESDQGSMVTARS